MWDYARARSGTMLGPGLELCKGQVWNYARARSGTMLGPGLGLC